MSSSHTRVVGPIRSMDDRVRAVRQASVVRLCVCPWNTYASVSSRYRTRTRAFVPFLSGPWQIARRAHPLSFFPHGPRLSYISCSAPEFQPQRTLYALLLKGSLRFSFPFPPQSTLSRSRSFDTHTHTRACVCGIT